MKVPGELKYYVSVVATYDVYRTDCDEGTRQIERHLTPHENDTESSVSDATLEAAVDAIPGVIAEAKGSTASDTLEYAVIRITFRYRTTVSAATQYGSARIGSGEGATLLTCYINPTLFTVAEWVEFLKQQDPTVSIQREIRDSARLQEMLTRRGHTHLLFPAHTTSKNYPSLYYGGSNRITYRNM